MSGRMNVFLIEYVFNLHASQLMNKIWSHIDKKVRKKMSNLVCYLIS